MQAVEADEDYALLNPRERKTVAQAQRRKVFESMVTLAWKNGDPGIVFIDRMNADNPTPQLGEIECTNPCGEQPLLPYEAATSARSTFAGSSPTGTSTTAPWAASCAPPSASSTTSSTSTAIRCPRSSR